MRNAAIRRMTAASEERRISGSVYAARLPKSSSLYKRMHTPAAMRPQRPARWFAAAWLIFSICSNCTLFFTE